MDPGEFLFWASAGPVAAWLAVGLVGALVQPALRWPVARRRWPGLVSWGAAQLIRGLIALAACTGLGYLLYEVGGCTRGMKAPALCAGVPDALGQAAFLWILFGSIALFYLAPVLAILGAVGELAARLRAPAAMVRRAEETE